MNTLAILIRCTFGCALGSSLGVVFIIAGSVEQGIGLAIVGGVLGLILAISSFLYKSTASETFTRGLLLFLWWTARKNTPFSEKLIPIEDKDIPGTQPQTGDPIRLEHRMVSGAKLGAAVTVVPVILAAIHIRDADGDPEPIVMEILREASFGLFVVVLVGGGCGAALGALTLRGVHRRNILLGTLIGTCVGAGVATATAPWAQIPARELFCGFCAMFGYLGMGCGMFSGDNFRRPGSDAGEDRDHDRMPGE